MQQLKLPGGQFRLIYKLVTTLPDTTGSSIATFNFDVTSASGIQNNSESLESLLCVASNSFSTSLLEVMTLHLTPLLIKLFTWSIISATKGLTTNTELLSLFSEFANPSFESMRTLGKKDRESFRSRHTKTSRPSYIASMEDRCSGLREREMRHFQRWKSVDKRLRKTWTARHG